MRRFVVVVLLVLGVVSIPALAGAHPLGNFSINQYVGLQLAHGALGVDYVLDLAEIPAVREREAIGYIGEYAASKCDELAPGLRIAIDGTPVSLEAMSSFASFLPGQAGLENTATRVRISGFAGRGRRNSDHRQRQLRAKGRLERDHGGGSRPRCRNGSPGEECQRSTQGVPGGPGEIIAADA